MRAITFTIELLQPLLATGFEGDPNSGVSLDYVPGSVIRGAVIAQYLRKESKKELDATDATERALFLDGTVRYLNAYPLVREKSGSKVNEIRSLPMPLSWHKTKEADEGDKSTQVHDFSQQTRQEAFPDDEQNQALKRSFFAFIKGGVHAVKLEHRLTVHTQRNPRKGRAIDDDGAVFRYQSVAKGTRFGGAIVCSEEFDKNILDKTMRGLLENKELALGGSRTGGYGRARIRTVDFTESNWLELQTSKASAISITQPIPGTFTLTLLSHALLRDENGHPKADITIEDLGLQKMEGQRLEGKTFKRAEMIGGFNRKWGLPLPQTAAVKAGSVFTFKVTSNITETELQTLLDEGIGERRLDGFGRIAINLNTAQTLSIKELEKAAPQNAPLTSPTGMMISRTLVKRDLQQRFEEELVRQVAEHEINRPPKGHQISRLRLALREALINKKTDPVAHFIDNLKKTARDQFDKATEKNSGKRLLRWVEATLNDESLFNESPITLGVDAGTVTIKSDELRSLRLKYRIRLVDKVLQRAAKTVQRQAREAEAEAL